MIDKARVSQAGTLGACYRYPCPIDAACLNLLGIDANTFRGTEPSSCTATSAGANPSSSKYVAQKWRSSCSAIVGRPNADRTGFHSHENDDDHS